MTSNDTPVPSLVTRARVAHPRSLVIDEVDGLPPTHTPPTATPIRKVTTGPTGAAPLPLAANQPARRRALVPWWSLLLSLLALSCLGAVTAWLRLPPIIGAAGVVSMSFCCLVVVIAELVHRVNTHRPTR